MRWLVAGAVAVGIAGGVLGTAYYMMRCDGGLVAHTKDDLRATAKATTAPESPRRSRPAPEPTRSAPEPTRSATALSKILGIELAVPRFQLGEPEFNTMSEWARSGLQRSERPNGKKFHERWVFRASMDRELADDDEELMRQLATAGHDAFQVATSKATEQPAAVMVWAHWEGEELAGPHTAGRAVVATGGEWGDADGDAPLSSYRVSLERGIKL